MAFFFIPAGVAIMDTFDVLARNLLPFLAVCFISTLVTFAATVFTVRGILWLQRLIHAKSHPSSGKGAVSRV